MVRHARLAAAIDHLRTCLCHRCCVSPTVVTTTLVDLDSHTSRPCGVLMCREQCGENRETRPF